MKLQSVAIDVVHVYAMVESVVSTLKHMRRESESEFHKEFTEATTLGKKLHGDSFVFSRPRITGRQTNRDNIYSNIKHKGLLQDHHIRRVPLSRSCRDGGQIC